jgi:hypothetical protein
VELRASVRYSLDLPLTFAWKDNDGHERHGAGFTRDISSGGMYVFSDLCPEEAVIVRCSLLLPRLDGADSMGGIEAIGRVIRRGARDRCLDEPAGFAVMGDCMFLSLRATAKARLLEREEQHEQHQA